MSEKWKFLVKQTVKRCLQKNTYKNAFSCNRGLQLLKPATLYGHR
jgi:hypothetical protein